MIITSEIVPVDSLSPNAWNPNQMSKADYKALLESIGEFGFLEAVIALPDGTIINGEHRWRAMKELGEPEIEVKFLNVSEEVAQYLTAHLDSIRGSFDPVKLGELINRLDSQFQRKDLVEKLNMSDKEKRESVRKFRDQDIESRPKQVEEVEEKAPVAPGEIYRLGEHIVMCGDSSNSSHINDLMQFVDGAITLLVTDPPYGVDRENVATRFNAMDGGNRRTEHLASDSLDEDSIAKLSSAFQNIRGILAKVHAYYIFVPSMVPAFKMLLKVVEDGGFKPLHQLVWLKHRMTFSSAYYKYRHEMILHGWGEKHNFKGLDSEDSVWEVPTIGRLKDHPTEKPVKLYIRAVLNSSDPGDYIIDPFAGVGTIISAAQDTDRRGIGIEINPEYVSTIISRFENRTGLKAVKLHG